jgi:hypothetical protein
MDIGNLQLHEVVTPVTGLAPITPSTTTPDYVSLKNFHRLRITVLVTNATTVTGSAITLLQATAVAGTSEKAIAFTKMWANTDTAAGDTLTETAVTGNTFTTDATNSKNLIYVMEVGLADLDIAGGFDCVRIGTGDAVAATLAVLYDLYPAKYGKTAGGPTAITD